MNRHASADNDETTCQSHHVLVEEIAQLKERERVLVSENDQLRAQLVEMKEEAHKKYDDLMVQYNMKREYEDGTSNNQVTVKTEWDHEEVKVEIKEEDDDIIIKQEYVSAYIKTESSDVKVEIKEEDEEENDDNDCDGCERCLVKKEEVSDDDEVDNEGGLIRGGDNDEVDDERYEVTQPNVDCGQLLSNPSRDRKNDSNANESIEEGGTNLSSQQHNTTTLNEPNEVTTVTQSAQTFSPQTSTGHGSSRTALDQQTTVPTQDKANKRRQQTSKRSAKRSKITIEVGEDGEDIANEDRARELHRTETVQEVSSSVAVDEREMDKQNGGGEGLGQIEDDETELNEEDEGGHYKIEIIKLKCTEDGCEDEVADREELNDHLRLKHHISPYRCLAVGCNERFEQWGGNGLARHVQHNHSNISTWPCALCTKTFKTHGRLYNHLYIYHFEGQFKCGYDACHYDRVATLRIEIQSHQLSVHRKTTIFTCQFPNCSKSFAQKGHFNRHQLIHQKVKPFKCTWNMCDYAATQQTHVIKHIRTQHFHLPATEKKQRELGIEDTRNPRDYFEHEHN